MWFTRLALSLATCLVVTAQSYSDHEYDSDAMQNDPDISSRLESLRTTRSRSGGYGDPIQDERSLLREERKRLKAERRRLKEERRQERWARRRQQKQAGHRNHLNGGDAEEEEDDIMDFDDHIHPMHRTPVVRVSSSSGSSGSSSDSDPSSHGASSSSSASSMGPSRSVGSTDYLSAEPTPEVIDLEWMKANLSSLWSIVRSLSRQQGRPFINRGGRGRHHHSGVVDSPPDPAACPGMEDACRSEGSELCGGHGVCSCGHCFCHPGYYGTFCQCDDHSCPVYDGMTCGGPSRGQCRCGGCVCRPGYTGDSCDCPTETQTCISPDSDEICSGKGTCSCGRCRCNDGHKGMYCEDTVYAAGVCEKLKSCVMCRAWNRDLPSCAHCQITVTTVESLEPSMTTCVMVNSGCLLQFSYIPQTADAYTVLVPRDMVCPA